MRKKLIRIIPFLLLTGLIQNNHNGFAFSFTNAKPHETQVQYLSGTGNDNTIDWDFYCTGGRNSGFWTTIPVPSCWELQGFGTYNYGHDKDSVRGMEKGIYKYKFNVPAGWKGKTINIVFEGSMTDTKVKINGKSAGPVNQGSFYRFKYDISNLLKTGADNLLEVEVAKHSENESVNRAERKADYWIFGGIFRPVYLEALPKQHIRLTKINAKANGNFTAEFHLGQITKANELKVQIYTLEGEKTGSSFSKTIKKNDDVVTLNSNITDVKTWSPEFPNLYYAKFTLLENGNPVHIVKERFGFRTIELREREGIYLNGTKIKFRGVCRHSFWPTSGRTMSKTLSMQDANMIKDMNMNAVRNSHYPADSHFYDVCDSLGIMVIDELAGWHAMYDTEVGSKLVSQMLESNANHPSIVIWANGNEGGHNHELLPLFDNLDIQGRPVMHPWKLFRGIDAQHYTNYNYGNGTHLQGHNVVLSTEFLHGLYDGGLGAGLEDYWELMWRTPLSAGGFLWVFADEGVVRTDRNNEIDTDGDHAPDGILGPFREKEGSYFTIKEVWSPVFFEHREITPRFDGNFTLENRFFFTDINQCSFSWEIAKTQNPYNPSDERETKHGNIKSPEIPPGQKGLLSLSLPENWQDYDILYITAFDPHNREIFTWSWPITLPDEMKDKLVNTEGINRPEIKENEFLYTITANGIKLSLNRNTGLLDKVENKKGVIPFNNGPILCDGENGFASMTYHYNGQNLEIEYKFDENSHYSALKWIIYSTGWIKLDVKYIPVQYESNLLGIGFSYPEDMIKAVRYMGNGPYRVWKNRIKGNNLNVWEKEYNNTITGERGYIYPEFKGYHSNMYWAKFITTEQPFTVVTSNEDIFLRLFTPEPPGKPYNTAPPFPTGDISFMQGIPPIGTKSQRPENMGPMSRGNMYFHYWKRRPKEMTLYFDFSGN